MATALATATTAARTANYKRTSLFKVIPMGLICFDIIPYFECHFGRYVNCLTTVCWLYFAEQCPLLFIVVISLKFAHSVRMSPLQLGLSMGKQFFVSFLAQIKSAYLYISCCTCVLYRMRRGCKFNLTTCSPREVHSKGISRFYQHQNASKITSSCTQLVERANSSIKCIGFGTVYVLFLFYAHAYWRHTT